AVHDVGSVDDRAWLAMEYVEGRTLAKWLSVSRSWPEVVATLTAAGRGVEAAHAAGLVHRDLKPSNLIIGDDGRVRVMDFGLVRARDELAELDATGEHSKLDSDGSSPELLATAT